MSEPQSAVALIKDVPHYELTAQELVFPLKVEQDGGEFVVLFHVAPYLGSELKDLLNALGRRFVTTGRATVRMEPGSREATKPFFDRYFLKMGGIAGNNGDGPPSLEMQKAFLADNDYLKSRAVLEGYGGIIIEDAEESEAKPKVFRLDMAKNRIVKTGFTLYSVERNASYKIGIDHTLKKESAADLAKYEKATSLGEMNIRKQEWRSLEDYEAIEKLYDSLILSVSGAVVNGTICTEENQKEWVRLIPFWFKSATIDEAFRRVRIKNV
jgi:hypothetical protein